VQIVLTKKKDLTLILLTWRIRRAHNNASKWQMGFNLALKGLRLLQSSHNIMPFCGSMCATTKTKGESLKKQTFSDLFDVSSGCPLSFNPTTTKSQKKFQPHTDACDTCIENVTLYKNY
jgi:hypothetical protein